MTAGKLGRRPTDLHRLANTVRLRLTGQVPEYPLVSDHLSLVPSWILGANDRYGTCGPVSVANHAVMTWKYLLGESITVTDDAVFDLYRRSGNPGFDPGTGAGDDGVDMTVMLSALVKGGIEITHADGTREIAKPLCFAAHGTSIDMVRAVTAIFGGSLFALNLATAQQTQEVWDWAAGSGSWGGHATMAGAYTSASGQGQADESNVTWAEVIGTTDLFVEHQLAESYAVVWPALWAHPVFQAGIDQAALAEDYERCTGRPFPVPVPSPEPPPSPVPPPPAADQDDISLWNRTRGWAGARHWGSSARVARALRTWATAKGLG